MPGGADKAPGKRPIAGSPWRGMPDSPGGELAGGSGSGNGRGPTAPPGDGNSGDGGQQMDAAAGESRQPESPPQRLPSLPAGGSAEATDATAAAAAAPSDQPALAGGSDAGPSSPATNAAAGSDAIAWDDEPIRVCAFWYMPMRYVQCTECLLPHCGNDRQPADHLSDERTNATHNSAGRQAAMPWDDLGGGVGDLGPEDPADTQQPGGLNPSGADAAGPSDGGGGAGGPALGTLAGGARRPDTVWAVDWEARCDA